MSKYYRKKLKDFKIGEPVIINDDISYVTSINVKGDIITLILSGVCNHTGDKESTITTYGTPKRIRRTKEQIEEAKICESEAMELKKKEEQELTIVNAKYKEFIKTEGIDDDIRNFKRVNVESISVGDFIKRGKNQKVEKVLEIKHLEENYIYVKGYMGFDRSEEFDIYSIPKECFIYKYKILN